jgi:hypothetical protein
MPFGLKNAGATYKCTMQKCLADQIGRNIHAYVDDIAVISKKQDGLIADLQETFDNLRKYNMMLNPTKCLSGYQLDNSWDSSSPTTESKSTQRRSGQSSTSPGLMT